MSNFDPSMTVDQVAGLIDKSPRYVRMLIADGVLVGSKRNGRTWIVDGGSVNTYLSGQPGGTELGRDLDGVFDDATNPRVLIAELDASEREIVLLRDRLSDKEAEVKSLRTELHHLSAALTEIVAKNFSPDA